MENSASVSAQRWIMIQGLKSHIGVFLFRRNVLFEDTLRLRYNERQM